MALLQKRGCRHGRDNLAHDPACPVCQEHLRHPWMYEESVGGPFAAPPPEPAPCRHRGELIPLARRHESGVGTLRDWYKCGLGLGINGCVCPCLGCGPGCGDYAPGPPGMAGPADAS
jgi:hypothetical protein